MPHPRPWHRGSLFTEGPRIPRDREQRARFRYLVRAHLQARRLTHAGAAVAESLLRRLGTDGQCDPCHDTLAADAACSARTVARATAAMLRLGLLAWQRRLVREGPRAVQTSNQYMLLIGGQVAVPLSGRQGGRGIRQKILNLPSPGAVAAARAALAARAREVEAKMLLNK